MSYMDRYPFNAGAAYPAAQFMAGTQPQQFNPNGAGDDERFEAITCGSEDEVRASIVPLGISRLFLVRSTGKIYLKRVNKNTGLNELFEYNLNKAAAPAPAEEKAEASAPAPSQLEGKVDALTEQLSALVAALAPGKQVSAQPPKPELKGSVFDKEARNVQPDGNA